MRKLCTLVLCFLMAVSQLLAQTKTVTGKVVDDKGASIAGATILEKGTRNGVSAGSDGAFTIKVKAGATLVITAIGFEDKVVSAANAGTIQLTTDTKSLSEVVVTGLGAATSKKKLAIAVESVNSDKLPSGLTADAGQALIGKIPGAQISSTNGSPGSPVNILLRGVNSLRAGTLPMILLDGIQVAATDLNSIDLNGIDRIEVVQGAASASLYGAQGANGVIQLFSKKGKAGKTRINFSSSVASNELLNIGGVHKARYHSLPTDANNNVLDGTGSILTFDNDYSSYFNNVSWASTNPATNNNKLYDKNLQYYDHYAMFFQNTNTYNNSLSISGAKDGIDFNISASDNRQKSVFKGNGDYSRSNLISNLGIELAKGLKFRSLTQLVYTKNTLLDPDGRTYFFALNNSRPFANYDYKSPDGNYGAYFGDAVGVNGYNPNYQSQYGSYLDKKIDVIQSFNLNYKLNKYVEFDAKYGINYQTEEAINNIQAQDNNLNADYWQYWLEYYYPRTSYAGPVTATETGEINTTTYKTTFQNFLANATVRFDFDKDLHIKVPIKSTTLFAYDYRKNDYSTYATYSSDVPDIRPYRANQLANQVVANDYTESFLTYGFLANQKFDYGEIGGVSAGFRSDYSSAFGRGQTPQAFPNANAYLRISALPFWKGKLSDVVSEFKIRSAYGEAGIQPGAFDRQPTLTTRTLGSGAALIYRTANPNPDLNVEVSKEFEVGTDISFNGLKGKWLKTIDFHFTYWKRNSDNVIYSVDAAPSSGTGTVLNNAFGLGSNGLQASLNLGVLSSKKITWNFTANFSKQTSKITALLGAPIVVTSAAGSSGYILRAGEKIGQLYGYRLIHAVDEKDESGTEYIAKANQVNFAVASNGWVVYNDPTKASYKQPFVSPSKYSFGDPNPKFNMSFINEVTFKNFITFSAQVDWVSGSHIYNQTKQWMYRDGIHGDYDKQITINNETGAWTAFYRGTYAQVQANGTKNYFYEDASFVRLRNISFALDFAKLFKIKQFERIQLVLSGRNLVTITNYTGYDPEVSSGTANSAFDRGVDHNTVPNLKSYQIGLNIGL